MSIHGAQCKQTCNHCSRPTPLLLTGSPAHSVRRRSISNTSPRSLNTQRPHDQPSLAVDFPSRTSRQTRLFPREDSVRSIDNLFNKYGERLRSDLRDMHGLCTQLVAQDQQAAAKWYAFCAKVIVERDQARQRVQVLSQGRSDIASSVDIHPAGLITSKRNSRLNIQGTRSDRSASPSESHHIKAAHLSPIHSPSVSTSSPSTPMTAFPPSTTFSPFDQQIKRRRSFSPVNYNPSAPGHIGIKQQPRTPSPITFPSQSSLANFSHVDLMYVSTRGVFVCRACLLQKSKSPTFEPKIFSLTASWDELRDHCIEMHPEACADVARLQPAEVFELRRRLNI